MSNMHPSVLQEYLDELYKQEDEQNYLDHYWLMYHACITLTPHVKEGTDLKPEGFIGPAPWERKEEAAVEATPAVQESDEDLVELAESKGLRGPERDGS